MSVKGIWKGEVISPAESNRGGKDISSSAVLIISHGDIVGQIKGTLNYNPEDGIEESAELLGEIKVNEIFFVQLLSNFYFLKYNGKVGVEKYPNPETYFEGSFIKRDFIRGTWIMNRTYRLIGDRVVEIEEAKGNWWFKKIREHQYKD